MMGSIIVRQKRTLLVLEKNLAITVSIDWHGLHRPNFGNIIWRRTKGRESLRFWCVEAMPVAYVRGALRWSSKQSGVRFFTVVCVPVNSFHQRSVRKAAVARGGEEARRRGGDARAFARRSAHSEYL